MRAIKKSLASGELKKEELIGKLDTRSGVSQKKKGTSPE